MKHLLWPSSVALALLFPLALCGADPISEMAEFSVFGKVNLAELEKGGVMTAAGSPMSTERYLSVQSCFLIPQPPAKVIAAMRQFNPAAHRELNVLLHSDLSGSPSAADFSKLNHPANNRAL